MDLFKQLKEFAGQYNHTFQPKTDEYKGKYGVVCYNGDLSVIKYNGSDVYSEIWFDDKAVARLSIELFYEELTNYFSGLKDGRVKIVKHPNTTVICKKCKATLKFSYNAVKKREKISKHGCGVYYAIDCPCCGSVVRVWED